MKTRFFVWFMMTWVESAKLPSNIPPFLNPIFQHFQRHPPKNVTCWSLCLRDWRASCRLLKSRKRPHKWMSEWNGSRLENRVWFSRPPGSSHFGRMEKHVFYAFPPFLFFLWHHFLLPFSPKIHPQIYLIVLDRSQINPIFSAVFVGWRKVRAN